MVDFDIVDLSKNDPEKDVRKPKDLDDEWPKAVRGFLILVIMVWLIFFSIIAMIHLGEILL